MVARYAESFLIFAVVISAGSILNVPRCEAFEIGIFKDVSAMQNLPCNDRTPHLQQIANDDEMSKGGRVLRRHCRGLPIWQSQLSVWLAKLKKEAARVPHSNCENL